MADLLLLPFDYGCVVEGRREETIAISENLGYELRRHGIQHLDFMFDCSKAFGCMTEQDMELANQQLVSQDLVHFADAHVRCWIVVLFCIDRQASLKIKVGGP